MDNVYALAEVGSQTMAAVHISAESFAAVRFWQLDIICRVLTTAVRCLVVGWGWHSLCMSHSSKSWLESVFPTTFKHTIHCEIHSRSQRGWLSHRSFNPQQPCGSIKSQGNQERGKVVHSPPTHHSSFKNLCTSFWHAATTDLTSCEVARSCVNYCFHVGHVSVIFHWRWPLCFHHRYTTISWTFTSGYQGDPSCWHCCYNIWCWCWCTLCQEEVCTVRQSPPL